MNPKPLITVIIAAYDAWSTLPETLNSLRHQDCWPLEYEVIVIDDGSIPALDSATRQFRTDTRYRYLRTSTHVGLAAACNIALDAAKADYFVRVDADDTVSPNFLRALWDSSKGHSNFLCTSDRWVVTNIQGSINRQIQVVEENNIFSLVAAGVLMSTASVRRISGYRNLFWSEFDLYIRLFKSKSIAGINRIPEPLYTYRRDRSQLTSNKHLVQVGWQQLIKIWGAELVGQSTALTHM